MFVFNSLVLDKAQEDPVTSGSIIQGVGGMWRLEGRFTAHVLGMLSLGVGIFIIGSHLYLHLGYRTDGASRIAKGWRRWAGNLQMKCNTTRKANKLELGIISDKKLQSNN